MTRPFRMSTVGSWAPASLAPGPEETQSVTIATTVASLRYIVIPPVSGAVAAGVASTSLPA
jgi:hypothetical protein